MDILLDLLISYWKELLPQKSKYLFLGVICIVTLWVAYTGAKQLIAIINPITVLSRNADLPAIEWVEKNIPVNETIVINPFAWGYGLYAGSDGGYWISPLSGSLHCLHPCSMVLDQGVNSSKSKV